MKAIKLNIQIKSITDTRIRCLVWDEWGETDLLYNPEQGEIAVQKENHLSQIIAHHKFQFEKVVRSAIKGNINPKQTINTVFIEGFNFLKDADFYRTVQVDRLNHKLAIKSIEAETDGFYKIYADGSYLRDTGFSGYGGFIEDVQGNRTIYKKSFKNGSSNLMELLAITEGLEKLKSMEKIQVYTDSRFVIRGLVQWIHFWKHNNWQTAHSKAVKFAEHWQYIDSLCDGKLMEFKWIKGHSGHEGQDLCHRLARKSAENPSCQE